MEREEFIMLIRSLSPRGAGVKISKNQELKKLLWDITSFLPEDAPQSLRIWCIREEILTKDNLPKCPVCGALPTYSTGKFLTYCSKKCAQLDKDKFIKKYGVEHHLKAKSVREKIKNTVKAKYGVENIGIITREKAKQTMLEKYGVENYTKTKEYREKLLKTSLEKYGTTHPSKSRKVKEKLKISLKKVSSKIVESQKATLIEKYGVTSVMYIPEVKEKVLKKYKQKVWDRLNIKLSQNKIKPLFTFEEFQKEKVKDRKRYKFLCENCKTQFLDHLDNGNIPICPHCYKKVTNPERLILEFLKSKNIIFETNNRTVLNSFEIDIYLPENKLGIEINGIYFHTYENLIKFRNLSPKEARNYHRLKWMLATNKNIKLLQFWDSEVIYKQDIVFSIIGNAIRINKKIYARNCIIKEIDENTAYEFFLENHIYDEPILGKTFALMYDGEIVQAISIGKARFKLKGYEIYRFATKKFISVIGGFQKLLKFAIDEMNINKLYSYVDLRLFNGESLEEAKFKRVKITKPNYYYTENFIKLIPREKFMRSKTGEVEKLFTKDKFQRVYDCGHMLYLLENY